MVDERIEVKEHAAVAVLDAHIQKLEAELAEATEVAAMWARTVEEKAAALEELRPTLEEVRAKHRPDVLPAGAPR